jgi:hypothetical protein
MTEIKGYGEVFFVVQLPRTIIPAVGNGDVLTPFLRVYSRLRTVLLDLDGSGGSVEPVLICLA